MRLFRLLFLLKSNYFFVICIHLKIEHVNSSLYNNALNSINMSECTRYLLEKCKNIDTYINFLDFIDNECFDDPSFVKEVLKYIISNVNSKIYESNVKRIIQCFTIPQLCRICTEVDSDYISYEEIILKVIDHYKYKRLRSYRYYLKHMLREIDDYGYISEFNKCSRQIYEGFDINILPWLVKQPSCDSYAIDCLIEFMISNTSFKQLKNGINKIAEYVVELRNMIKVVDFRVIKSVNVLFLKYLLKYFPDLLSDNIQKICLNYRGCCNTLLFTEKHFPKLIIWYKFESIKQKCEYIIRSKKHHNSPVFNLIKKILEKFSTKNICKMIMYF